MSYRAMLRFIALQQQLKQARKALEDIAEGKSNPESIAANALEQLGWPV